MRDKNKEEEKAAFYAVVGFLTVWGAGPILLFYVLARIAE